MPQTAVTCFFARQLLPFAVLLNDLFNTDVKLASVYMPTAAAQEQVPPAWPRLVLDLLGGASCGPACMRLSSCPVILSTVISADLGVINYVQRENTLVKRNLFVYGASCYS